MFDLYSISPKDFENLCCDYIKTLYNGKNNYIVHHTRYTHDGGRDIEVTFYDELHHFKIWAECKQHKRTLGLEHIGKNVVLVISKHINSVIFFSVSEVTESAQIEIIRIGERLNFNVSFLCGKRLVDRFKEHPKLLEKYFGTGIASDISEDNECKSNGDVDIQCSISEFDSGILIPVHGEAPVSLKNGDMFNIYIHLRNIASYPVTNITVGLDAIACDIRMMQTSWTHEVLSMHNEVVAHFKGEIISKRKSRIALPQVVLGYETNNAVENRMLTLPQLDVSKCKVYPFVGKSVTEFISKEIGEVLDWSDRAHSQIIDIRGISGSGKTRLASEIQKRAVCRGMHSIYLNASDYVEYDILRKLICELLQLPFYRGNINFSTEDIKELIRIHGGSETFRNVLSSLMCYGVFEREYSCYIVESIVHFINNPIQGMGYCIVIDNTQMLQAELLTLLIRLSELLSKNHSHSIIIFISNTERPANSHKTFQTFISYLDDKTTAHIPGFVSYTCSAFREEDVILFLMQVFGFKRPQDPLLIDLIKKVGRLPFEVTMTIEYLADMNIIEWHNAREWIISDYERYRNLMSADSFEKRSIIKQRVHAWKRTHTAAQNKEFTNILSAVVAFEGLLPYAYIADCGLNQSIIDQMNNMLWLIPSNSRYGMNFFHDNIMDYCLSMPEYKYNSNVLRRIVKWLDNEHDIYIPHRERIRFFCYYNIGQFAKAFAYAQELFSDAENLPRKDVTDISRVLFEDKRTKENPSSYIRVSEMYAKSLFSMEDKELGCKIYQEIIAYILQNHSAIDMLEFCKLLHRAINAQLQSAKYDVAIHFIQILEKVPDLPMKYRFIVENRYGVAYIALGCFDKAYEKLTTALSIASNQMDDMYWTSTAHSDIALYYFYNWKALGRETAAAHMIDEFQAAIMEYESGGALNVSRDIEMAWHKAFVSILQQKYDIAEINAYDCIQLSEMHSQAYGLTRGYNLFALCHLISGNTEKAMASLEEGLHACTLYSFPSGIFRMYNNLGVVHYYNGNYEKARKLFKLAANTMDGQIEYKQYPVLTNLMIVAISLNDKDLLDEIGQRCDAIGSRELVEFRQLIILNKRGVTRNESFSYWNFNGASYIF